jgi:hypothetical protein
MGRLVEVSHTGPASDAWALGEARRGQVGPRGPSDASNRGPRVSRLKSLDGVQLSPPYTDHACRRSYSPLERPVTVRRASGSGRSALLAIGKGCRVASAQGIGVPGA